MGRKTIAKPLALTSVCLAMLLQGCHRQSAQDFGAAKATYPVSLSGDWKVATTEDASNKQDQSDQFQTNNSARPRAAQKSQMFVVEMIDDHHSLTGTGQDRKGGFVCTGAFNSPEISMVQINNQTGERTAFEGKLAPGADPPYATGRWRSITTAKTSASGSWQANFYPPTK
jgi:hypothetical protein